MGPAALERPETMSENRAEPALVALPPGGRGPGVVLLHAWWGLNDFFTALAARLAAEGFVVAAPDLYGDGQSVATIEAAKARVATLDGQGAFDRASEAIAFLRRHEAVQGDRMALVGFSMGGSWALDLASAWPDAVAAVVLFYGSGEADYSQARAAYLGHFAENDPWEEDAWVRQMETAIRAAGHEVTFYRYPDTGHWFFEADRPDAYHAEAARHAWERTIAFLREQIGD